VGVGVEAGIAPSLGADGAFDNAGSVITLFNQMNNGERFC
jgi:hypothetical protein